MKCQFISFAFLLSLFILISTGCDSGGSDTSKCVTNMDCQTGQVCIEETCEEQECTVETDCPRGTSCKEGICERDPIGDPCNFGWPKNDDGTFDCDRYPLCHPLQDTGDPTPLNNMACPIDCIQMPSLECEGLLCVATIIEGNHSNMNGVCWTPENSDPNLECPDAEVACKGYCTMECLTDLDCPENYKCDQMAPFGSTLKCDDETLWGTECTLNCTQAGEMPPNPGATENCPSSGAGGNYDLCDQKAYDQCCTCICYHFCPILTKKFCHMQNWDPDGAFAESSTNSAICGN